MPIRLRAALFHLSVSAFVVALVIAFILVVWYPHPLDKAVDVRSVIYVLTAVDVTLGPLLTFIVYKKNKKSLRFDLSLIATLQISALIYGVLSIAQGRPAWLVFNIDRFDLVQAQDIDSTRIGKASLQYRRAPLFGPIWIASRNPNNPEEKNALMLESALGGADLPQRIDLYTALSGEVENLRAHSRDFDELKRFNSMESIRLARKRWPEADGWLPLAAKAQSMAVFIRRSDAKIVAVVELRPWRGE